MTDAVTVSAQRFVGSRVPRVEDRAAAHRARHLRRRHRAARHAPRLLRAQPVRPGPHRRHRRVRGAGAPRRARRVRRRRPQPGRARAVVHAARARRCRHAAAAARRGRGALRRRPGRARRRREPLRRRGRGRAGRRRLRAAAAGRRLPHGRGGRRARARPTTRATSSGSCAGAPASALDEVFAGGRPRRRARRSTSRRTRRCRWRRAAWSSSGTRRAASSRSGPRRRRRTRSGRSARGCSASPSTGSASIMRDTGGGFGQKIMVKREEMCLMLAAREGAGRGEVDRGPAREPDGGGQVAPRARRRPHGVRRRRHDPRRPHRLRAGRRRVPDAVAGRHRHAAVGLLFPGPYRVPGRDVHVDSSSSPTPSGAPRTAGRGSSSRVAREVLLDIAARRMGIDPVELRRRNLLRHDELPYTNPQRHDRTTASRPLETFEQALEMLDYDGFRREQAEARARGPLPRRRHVHLRRADHERHGHRSAPRARRSASSRRARSTSTSPAGPRATASRRRSCSSPPTRSASTSTTCHDPGRHRGHAVRRRAPAGAAAARCSPAPSARRPRCCASKLVAIAAHRLEAAPEDIELAAGRASVRGTPTAGMSLAEIARARVLPARRAPARRAAGPRGERPLHRRQPRRTGRTPPTCARARSTSPPARSRCCATSSARTAAR